MGGNQASRMGRPSRLRPRAQRAASQHGPAPPLSLSLSASGTHPVVLVTAPSPKGNGGAPACAVPRHGFRRGYGNKDDGWDPLAERERGRGALAGFAPRAWS